jgi:hypothetical protein
VALEAQSQVAGTLSWAVLLLGSLLAVGVVGVLYVQLRIVDPAVALWAFALGVARQIGAAAHAGYTWWCTPGGSSG